VFFADEAQKAATEAYIAMLGDTGWYDDPVVTTLEPLDTFYAAEADHQDYVELNPNQPYVRAIAIPKVKKLKEHHADLLKD